MQTLLILYIYILTCTTKYTPYVHAIMYYAVSFGINFQLVPCALYIGVFAHSSLRVSSVLSILRAYSCAVTVIVAYVRAA